MLGEKGKCGGVAAAEPFHFLPAVAAVQGHAGPGGGEGDESPDTAEVLPALQCRHQVLIVRLEVAHRYRITRN
jgi:hypothetical protein